MTITSEGPIQRPDVWLALGPVWGRIGALAYGGLVAAASGYLALGAYLFADAPATTTSAIMNGIVLVHPMVAVVLLAVCIMGMVSAVHGAYRGKVLAVEKWRWLNFLREWFEPWVTRCSVVLYVLAVLVACGWITEGVAIVPYVGPLVNEFATVNGRDPFTGGATVFLLATIAGCWQSYRIRCHPIYEDRAS